MRSAESGFSRWVVPAATTSKMGFWSRTIRTLNESSDSLMLQGRCSVSITTPGGKRNCPARKNARSQEKRWTRLAGVDYIITHCCPSSIQDIFSGGLYQRDALTDFLDEIRKHCRFKYWFFGHYHESMVVENRFVMLYEQIIRLK